MHIAQAAGCKDHLHIISLII